MCKSEFTGWAIIEELSIRRRLRTFLISWGQKTRVKHCYVDYCHDMSSGLRQHVPIWTSFRIFLPQCNNFRDSFDCLGQLKTENRFYWNTTTWNNFITDMSLLPDYCKMWKSNVKSIVISHVGLPELSQTTCFSDEFPGSVIAQSLTMSAHCRQSPERQNIIDRTHTWQQCSVTISGDISTTKYGFNLR